MSVQNSLSDYIAIVRFIKSKTKKSTDEAIAEGEVPLDLRELVYNYFEPPFDITAPSIFLGDRGSIKRCEPNLDAASSYFNGYKNYLINERHWPESTVETLSQTSLALIRKMPQPNVREEFKEKGLVVGYIQSGKTANMTALIARAADEGYKLFIVLGGLWKDLRAQTQRRMDQEITGRSEDPSDGPFVLHARDIPTWMRLTQAGLEGDFASSPNNLNLIAPNLAVIKKNKRIEMLRRWLEISPVPLEDLPAVIIDDEADQGSINTNYGRYDKEEEPLDPSKTNGQICELLKALPKCVYIGFTATPFANVLIDADETDDLYPRNFIVTLPEPPGYFGPRKLFGLGMDPSDLSPSEKEMPGLDVIRYVSDEELDKIDHVLESGEEVPEVFSKPLLAFVLSCCARLARGHDKSHFSMLVHPSQLTSSHDIFANAIQEELDLIRSAAKRPAKFPYVLEQAKTMWDEDFRRVTQEQEDPKLHDFTFETVWKFAESIAESIEIKILNFSSDDTLEYSGRPKRYIVVGGNRLSRGLTLEGLSVSIFTRKANQYDTLLQMGRWFGYRPEYHDLTRIFVSRQIANRFAELARVEEELRYDLRKYAEEPNPPTPLELKPRIRRHPTMAVTSALKMGAGKPINISFQNSKQQTVVFPVENKELLQKNLRTGKAFMTQLPETWTSLNSDGAHIWTDIPAEQVLEFLSEYEFSREARDVNRKNLTSYISRLNSKGELKLWDVVLPKGSQKEGFHTWRPGVITHKVMRSPMTTASIKVLSSNSDIEAWQSEAQRDRSDPSRGCIMLYLIDKQSGLNKGINFFSSADQAEDILGLVFIFPESKSHETIEYISQ